MKNYKSLGATIGLIWFSLGHFLLFQHVDAELNKTDPTDNVNLSPFDEWLSAYYCLNKTAPFGCSANGQLTDKGIVNVTANEVGDYCKGERGCAKHALEVLKCVYLCKRDFWFANNASVHVLNQTIIDGCNSNTAITTVGKTYKKNNGMKMSQKMYIPFVASLATLAFIAMFNNM